MAGRPFGSIDRGCFDRDEEIWPGEDRGEVVEHPSELRGEVAGMLGVAVGVHGILGAADELSSVTLDQLRLIEAKLQ